jgi:PAS domain S-box-containing protein
LEALRRSEATLRDFIENATVSLHWVGADGTILWANQAELDLLGYTREEYIGRNIAEFHADEKVIHHILACLSRGETLRDFPALLRHRDGSLRHVCIDSSVLFENGKFVHTRCFTRDVTELRQQEEAGRLLAAIVDSSDDAIISKDLTGRITSWNRGAERIFGYTAQEVIGKSITLLIPEDRQNEEPQILARLQRGERVDHYETIRRRKDGRLLHISLTISPVRDGQGTIIGASKIARDITERKRAEEIRAQLSAIVESSGDAIYSYDPEGKIVSWNTAAEQLYGYTAGEMIGRNVDAIVPEERMWELRDIINPAVSCGRVIRHLETLRMRRSGQVFSALLTISPICDEEGKSRAFSVIARDITDQKRAAEELSAAIAKFESVFNQSGIFAGIMDLRGNLRQINDLAVDWCGYKREEVLDKPFWDTPWWRGSEQMRNRIRFATEQAASGIVFRETLRYWVADGSEHIVDFAMYPIRDQIGAVRFLHPTGIDITARVKAEEDLRASEERFRQLADAMPQMVWTARADGFVDYYNARWYEFTGLGPDDLGDKFTAVLHPDDREKCLATWRRSVETGEPYQMEYRIRDRRENTWCWFMARALPARDDQGRIVKWFGTCTDIDDEKRADESLRETQKLESLGLLAGGIAHDFNNLLTGVIGNASLLAEELPDASTQAETVQGLIDAAERMARLTSQMLAYSGRGHFVIEAVDLSKQVVQITTLIQASIPKNVDLRLSLASNLPLVDVDVSQLQQVIMNLVINAAEAVGTGSGSVQLSTSVETVGDEELRADVTHSTPAAGTYVLLTVEDTGSGMDEATRARIFDPFFTTKFTGRGLGLSSVLGIVRGHKGLITVDSQPGAGTTFRVFLPASAVVQKTEFAAPREARGKGTILVVDDEDLVRRMAKAALQRLGYAVITAVNGQEAVDLYSSNPDGIDMVLLDMTMPVMGGEEALRRMIEIRPDAAVVAMSGFDEREAKQRFGNRIAGFVQKPFTPGQLSARIAAAQRRG